MERKKRARPQVGGKLRRTETLTVRLDPEVKYFAEIGARAQRRTLSSFIEWAVRQAMEDVMLDEGTTNASTLRQVTRQLWDTTEAERFIRLAAFYPELLTLEEQVLWKLIQDCPLLWKDVAPGPNWWQLMPRGEPLRLPFDIPLLLSAWDTLK